MLNKILGGAVIVTAYWATLYLGFKSGARAATEAAEREQMLRENEELKRQLNSKGKRS
jgi:hypothetical protein